MPDVTLLDLTENTKIYAGDFFPFRPAGASLDRRVSWSNAIASMAGRSPENLLSMFALTQELATSSPTVLAYIGDSWIQAGVIPARLATAWQAIYGDGGAGYVGIGMNHGVPSSAITYNRTGTWTDRDNIDSPPGRGVDIADATSSDTATPAAVTITGTFNTAVIHYIKRSGGGDYRWRVDGGGWTTVATANATEIHATETISGLSTASHTVEIEVSVAGASGVRLLGVDCQRTGRGVRVHRLGNGGATAAQYASADSTIWSAGLVALAPTAVAVMLGTNDMSGNVVPATFGASLDAIIARIRAAIPLCDVILTPSADNGLTGKTYTMTQYRDEMRNTVIRNGCSFVDTYVPIGAYADGNSRGLYANSSHLNTSGYRVQANAILKAIG